MDANGTRQERREKRKKGRRDRMLQHGRSLIRVYRDAVLKRARQVRRRGTS